MRVRAVVQRVSRAAVRVGGEVVGSIGPGFCVLLGAAPEDSAEVAAHLADRVATLRIFADDADRMNLDLAAVGAEVLVVSQFTLFADTSRGHRPSFVKAGSPGVAAELCDEFVRALRRRGLTVATGRFGARMEVELVNDGPVTIVLTSGEPPWEADAG
jgi:D-tyrosyl-tRNA(Tyr) deacylase